MAAGKSTKTLENWPIFDVEIFQSFSGEHPSLTLYLGILEKWNGWRSGRQHGRLRAAIFVLEAHTWAARKDA